MKKLLLALLLLAPGMASAQFCDPSVTSTLTTNYSMCKPSDNQCDWNVCLNSFIDDVDTNIFAASGQSYDVTQAPYNVVCDGTTGVATTNVTGINAAITAAIAAGGGVIEFPVGTCYINAAISVVMPNSNVNVQFVGKGPRASVIQATTTRTIDGFIIGALDELITQRIQVRDLKLADFQYPLRLRNTLNGVFENLILSNSEVAIRQEGQNENHRFLDISIEGTQDHGISLGEVQGTCSPNNLAESQKQYWEKLYINGTCQDNTAEDDCAALRISAGAAAQCGNDLVTNNLIFKHLIFESNQRTTIYLDRAAASFETVVTEPDTNNGKCVGGANDGLVCDDDTDCPGGTCEGGYPSIYISTPYNVEFKNVNQSYPGPTSANQFSYGLRSMSGIVSITDSSFGGGTANYLSDIRIDGGSLYLENTLIKNTTPAVEWVDTATTASGLSVHSISEGRIEAHNLMDSNGTILVGMHGPVRDRGGQVFNTMAFGLNCDGATDTQGAIQDAVNAAVAAGGGTVLIPYQDALCRIGSPITINDDKIYLKGVGPHGGSEIRPLSTFTGNALIDVGDNVTLLERWAVRDLTLNCRDETNTILAIAGIRIRKSAQWSIENNGLGQCEQAIEITGDTSSVGNITDNIIGSTNTTGIYMDQATTVRIENNHIIEGVTGGGATSIAIDLDRVLDITIADNLIHNWEGNYAIDVAAFGAGTSGAVTISGNDIYDVNGGIQIAEDGGATITGNRIHDPKTGAGQPAINLTASDVTVSANNIMWDQERCVIVATSNASIVGNTLRNCVKGVYLNGATEITVQSNLIYDDTGTTTTHGIEEAGGADTNNIIDNVVEDATTADVTRIGASTASVYPNSSGGYVVDQALTVNDSITAAGSVTSGGAATPEVIGNDSDTTIETVDWRVQGNATDVGDGTEDVDIDITSLVGGVLTDHISIDADNGSGQTVITLDSDTGIPMASSATECMYLDASAIVCDDTNGCTKSTVNGTNFSYNVANFANAAISQGAWSFGLPGNLTGTTVDLRAIWVSNDVACSGGADDDVCWIVSTVGVADDEAFHGATLGTAVNFSDRCLANGDLMRSSPPESITTGWTAYDTAVLNIRRNNAGTDCGAGNNDYAATASLRYVELCYEVDNVHSGE